MCVMCASLAANFYIFSYHFSSSNVVIMASLSVVLKSCECIPEVVK